MLAYCDVVPVHPRPQPLESLTGYLIRLAEANLISTVAALVALLFQRRQLQSIRALSDLCPMSLDGVAAAAACPLPALTATTLSPVARKFGRTTTLTWFGRFLSGTLAPSLRYCPACLAERGYRSLLWRFAAVPGCAAHGCYLLDHCGHCSSAIPFLTSPLLIACCPACGRDLRCCRSAPLQDVDAARTRLEAADAVALVAPHVIETAERPDRMFGCALTACRRERGYTRVEVAHRLGISEVAVRSLEIPYNTPDKEGRDVAEIAFRMYRSARLSHYLAYLRALDVPVRDILARCDSPGSPPCPTSRW